MQGKSCVAAEGSQGQWMKYCETTLLALLDLGEKSAFVTHWNRFLREAVTTPSLEVFKASLDGALDNLV